MIALDFKVTDTAGPSLVRLRTGLTQRLGLHAQLAADAEKYLKSTGADKAKTQHRTAETLGAAPTKHLEKAYQAIEGEGTADAAMLRMPRASRLRAAFGDYVLRPGSGKKYLTIPAHKDAYGHRAGEFKDLIFMRLGPHQTPALARKVKSGKGLEVMFFLTKAAKIRHSPELIRFDLLSESAEVSISKYIDTLWQGGGA